MYSLGKETRSLITRVQSAPVTPWVTSSAPVTVLSPAVQDQSPELTCCSTGNLISTCNCPISNHPGHVLFLSITLILGQTSFSRMFSEPSPAASPPPPLHFISCYCKGFPTSLADFLCVHFTSIKLLIHLNYNDSISPL